MSYGVYQDWMVNPHDLRMRFVLASFRLAQKLHRWPKSIRWLALPYLGAYQMIAWWELGIELNHKAIVGPRLRVHHGVGLVVHENAVIGADCTLRHGTTLGNRHETSDCPTLGDRVDIGCNSVIIGRIKIGDDSKIGAGSVVLHDVAPGETVAGNPARPVVRRPA
jgi:putative colanic acid biosynthesis acetyltransferase WcaB